MGGLLELWMPIVVSAVIVFFASFLAWSVLPHHKADVRPLPNEEAFASALKGLGLTRGVYVWPGAKDGAEMKSEAFKQRYARGPWGNMTVLDAQPAFGRNLALVFVFYLVVGVFVAYITSLARSPGASYLEVFRVAGACAILAYCFGSIPNAIFFGKPLRFVVTDLVDGIVYGLLTAGTFAWLWPR